jgi:integrase/recombinase XerD
MSIADPRERAIMMVLKDSGISREDIVVLKYGDIQNEFETEKDVIHVRLVRQKELISYETFIGKNAIESLKAYLQFRKAKGEQITKDSPLIATVSDKAMKPEVLSTIFVRLSKKAGFLTSPHRFRKYFESHMGLSAPSILVKYWMGHSLGVEKSYFMPTLEKQRDAYAQAYKEIDIFRTETSDVERRTQMLIDQIVLVKPDVDKKALRNLLAKMKTTKDIDDMTNKGLVNILSMLKTEKESKHETDCQKIISESELSKFLNDGWKVITCLPSGKIVISNE